MRTLKSVFGVAGASLPVLYCGYLLYYFLDVSGSVQESRDIGLGPTLLGLGAVGLLFCIPLIVKIIRLFSDLRSSGPRSPGSDGRGGPDAPTSDGDGDGGFDADAVVARYLARRSTEAASATPALSPARDGGGSAKRPSFGRKVR